MQFSPASSSPNQTKPNPTKLIESKPKRTHHPSIWLTEKLHGAVTSWETNGWSPSQEILSINPEVQLCARNRLPHVPLMRQINPAHTHPSYFFKIYLILSSHLHLHFQVVSSLQVSLPKFSSFTCMLHALSSSSFISSSLILGKKLSNFFSLALLHLSSVQVCSASCSEWPTLNLHFCFMWETKFNTHKNYIHSFIYNLYTVR
jgi:hypothetical protein